ncbi:MAG TPA: MIP/aquaporin family protein [Thermoanaerobaculia bacterium]
MLRAVDARPEGGPGPEARFSLARRAVVEGIGTAFLLAVVVGSGIAGERLSGGNVAIALLANSTATGAGLVALILAFGPISGAHLNPAVTAVDVLRGDRPARDLLPYVVAQVAGALVGVAMAEAMFGSPVFELSTKARAGAPLVLAEAVATLGLLLVVFLASRRSVEAAAVGVGGYIAAAYWFTSSTSFANPAVTLARSLTDTFTGIRPADAPGFLAGQLAGVAAFVVVARWLEPKER